MWARIKPTVEVSSPLASTHWKVPGALSACLLENWKPIPAETPCTAAQHLAGCCVSGVQWDSHAEEVLQVEGLKGIQHKHTQKDKYVRCVYWLVQDSNWAMSIYSYIICCIVHTVACIHIQLKEEENGLSVSDIFKTYISLNSIENECPYKNPNKLLIALLVTTDPNW